jgi:hypothetical protein
MSTVFLSYAHQDNDVPQDWVNNFYKDLNNYARVYSGKRNLVIWKDDFNRDVRSETIEDRIKEGLNQADILIALVSPSYLESWWGAFEREYFLRFVLRDKDDVIRKNRIMNVIKLVISPDDINRLTRDLKANYSYNFCRFQQGLAKTINPDDAEYEEAIVALANSIAVKLKENTSSNVLRIFVGKTTEDLLIDNNRLITELEAFNSCKVEIVTTGNFGESLEEQKSEIEGIIGTCDYSIHLFGNGQDFETSRFQWEVVIGSLASMNDETKVISWIPSSVMRKLDKEEGDYISFIKNHVMNLDARYHDFIVNSFEDLLISIKEKIKV